MGGGVVKPPKKADTPAEGLQQLFEEQTKYVAKTEKDQGPEGLQQLSEEQTKYVAKAEKDPDSVLDAIRRRKITDNMSKIRKNMVVDKELWAPMIEKKILEFHDIQKIERGHLSDRDRAAAILEYLYNRPNKDYDNFVCCLEETNQEHLVNLMRVDSQQEDTENKKSNQDDDREQFEEWRNELLDEHIRIRQIITEDLKLPNDLKPMDDRNKDLVDIEEMTNKTEISRKLFENTRSYHSKCIKQVLVKQEKELKEKFSKNPELFLDKEMRRELTELQNQITEAENEKENEEMRQEIRHISLSFKVEGLQELISFTEKENEQYLREKLDDCLKKATTSQLELMRKQAKQIEKRPKVSSNPESPSSGRKVSNKIVRSPTVYHCASSNEEVILKPTPSKKEFGHLCSCNTPYSVRVTEIYRPYSAAN